MAQVERRRHKKTPKKEFESRDEDKPGKTEYAVAKYLREKLPLKKTTLLGHKVEYFNAAKAVDSLLDSPWASGSDKHELLFTTRESVVDYMNLMLEHKFFHRAKKIVIPKKVKKKKEKEEESKEEPKEKKSKEGKAKGEEEKKSKDGKGNDEEKEKKEGEEIKKLIKLDMHLEQYFVDGNEPYVWIYDPIPLKAWVIGTLLVVGAVAVCLFPLWPKTVRHYVYYLSIATALLLGVILSLAVVRHILFVIIWLLTLGRHHFWLLPNLTEDVGFLESFWPLYKHEYRGPEEKASTSKSEEEKEVLDSGGGGGDDENLQQPEESQQDQSGKDSDSQAHTDSDKDSGQKGSGENGDNGFEILDPPSEKQS